MNYGMLATSVRTELPVARLKPAAGAKLRQARPTNPREVEERAGFFEFQVYNRGRTPGRQVKCLHACPNDVRALAPGVYFIREEGPRVQGFEGSRVSKVVVTR